MRHIEDLHTSEGFFHRHSPVASNDLARIVCFFSTSRPLKLSARVRSCLCSFFLASPVASQLDLHVEPCFVKTVAEVYGAAQRARPVDLEFGGCTTAVGLLGDGPLAGLDFCGAASALPWLGGDHPSPTVGSGQQRPVRPLRTLSGKGHSLVSRARRDGGFRDSARFAQEARSP